MASRLSHVAHYSINVLQIVSILPHSKRWMLRHGDAVLLADR
jgi:hypothetical protein